MIMSNPSVTVFLHMLNMNVTIVNLIFVPNTTSHFKTPEAVSLVVAQLIFALVATRVSTC